jgi:hypothetical protein
MKLVKLKLRGLGEIPETDWFEISPGLNLIQVRTASRQAALIEALQTINPPYHCREFKPFADLPRQITSQGHARRVAPHKRTIVLGVFNSSPELVQELATISPLLYETDLIEVGRRLDYSRWINFIELASSTRWEEIASEISALIAKPGPLPGNVDTLPNLLGTLAPTDRIKGAVMTELADAIEAARADAAPADRAQLTDLLHRIRRAQHFAAARAVIKARLPLLAAVDLNRLPSWRFGSLFPQSSAHLPPTLCFLLERLHSNLQASSLPTRNDLLTRLHQELSCRQGRPEVAVRQQQHHLAFGVPAAGHQLQPIDELDPLDRLDVCCRLITALSAVLLNNQPILLVSLPERMTEENRDRLAQLLMEPAKAGQCLCAGTDGWSIPGIEPIIVDDQSGQPE